MKIMKKNMFGWCGRILKIDLSNHAYNILSPDLAIYTKYIGGKGLAGYFLREKITLEWQNPDMPLLFFTGPLVNTISPTSGRMAIVSRSPLTGTIGDTSVGGSFGTNLKRAGWDGIIITGKSKGKCGIEINNGHVDFQDANLFNGKRVNECHSILKDKGSTAIIGPAAENNVLFSCIVIDNHFFTGRNGLGLLFSAKNLKYITVRGNQKTNVYDKLALKTAREDIFRLTSASPVLMGELGISHYGTGALYDLMDARRMMPTENFRKTHFPHAKEMNAYAFEQKYNPRMTGCRGCHVQCKKLRQDGNSLPEFETMSHFSALIDNKDIDTVVEANILCNNLGMDTISTAATIACYLEITGKKYNPDEILTLIEQIGSAKGIGKELGQGSYRYAVSQGKKESAMTIKNMELPGYDPRGSYGMALAYATSTRGGCHLRAYPISHEILRKPVVTDRFTFNGKARIIKIAEDMNAVIDSLTACKFLFFAVTLEEYAKAYSAVTGLESSAQDLLKIGERIYYQERIMNSLNGFSYLDDDLPERFFKDKGTDGNNIEIPALSKQGFLKTLHNYYKIRGLDEKGQPLKEKTEELDLTWKN